MTEFDLSAYDEAILLVMKTAKEARRLRKEYESPNHGLPGSVTYTQEQIDARGAELLAELEAKHLSLINIFVGIVPAQTIIDYLNSM